MTPAHVAPQEIREMLLEVTILPLFKCQKCEQMNTDKYKPIAEADASKVEHDLSPKKFKAIGKIVMSADRTLYP